MAIEEAKIAERPQSGAAASPAPPAGVEAVPSAAAASREWSNEHPVNIRLSVPLLFGRFYVTLLAGPERRSPERLSAERRKHPLWKAGNLLVMLLAGSTIALALLAFIQLVGLDALQNSQIVTSAP